MQKMARVFSAHHLDLTWETLINLSPPKRFSCTLVHVQADLFVRFLPLNCLCLLLAAKLEIKTLSCYEKGISYFHTGKNLGIQEILQESFFSCRISSLVCRSKKPWYTLELLGAYLYKTEPLNLLRFQNFSSQEIFIVVRGGHGGNSPRIYLWLLSKRNVPQLKKWAMKMTSMIMHDFLGFSHLLLNPIGTIKANCMHICPSFKSFVKTQNNVELGKKIVHWSWLLIVRIWPLVFVTFENSLRAADSKLTPALLYSP